MKQIDETHYNKAIVHYSKAKSIYVLDLCSSYSAGNWLSFSLGFVKDNVHFMRPKPEDVIRTITQMDEHSVLIIVSFHRYLKETIQIAELARK